VNNRRETPVPDPPHPVSVSDMSEDGVDARTAALLRIFVPDGRLLRLPARRVRRRLVLEYLAQSFEPGRRFPEREVDAVLRAWCAGGEVDHVTLRRYLLDEGLLSRDHGTYWRIGGWVDVLGASAS
jgi:hypothetical protein